jgi:NitT/TauT family transport system substrate-binding protein
MRRLALVLTLVLASSLSGCAAMGRQAPSSIKIAMGYVPNVQFAPMYVALEKGYFADENLKVELDYGWETDILALLGAGQLQFAIASGEEVILARARELPVVYVFDWYNRFPVSVVSLADSGIRRPEDLIGKTVGTPATFGSSYIGWRALLNAVGIAEDQVSLATIGYTQAAALTSGQVDAALGFHMNEPVQLMQEGYAISELLVADYVSLPAAGIVSNDATVNADPQLVERVTRAFSRGLRYTLDHPDEAFEIAQRAVPEIAADSATQRAVLDASVALWQTDDIGVSDEATWRSAEQFMLDAGLIEREVAVEALFTNRFVPKGD